MSKRTESAQTDPPAEPPSVEQGDAPKRSNARLFKRAIEILVTAWPDVNDAAREFAVVMVAALFDREPAFVSQLVGAKRRELAAAAEVARLMEGA